MGAKTMHNEIKFQTEHDSLHRALSEDSLHRALSKTTSFHILIYIYIYI